MEEFYRILDLQDEDLTQFVYLFRSFESKRETNKQDFAFMHMINFIITTNDNYMQKIIARETTVTEEDLYVMMIQSTFKLFLILRKLKEENKTYLKILQRIENILNTFYQLEEGIFLKLGFRLEPLKRKDSEDVQKEKLCKNDLARKEFKNVILKDFSEKITEIIDRNLVIYYAEKLYWNVHCFQAPPRFDPELALKDAQRMTDHYKEMIREILSELGVKGEEINE